MGAQTTGFDYYLANWALRRQMLLVVLLASVTTAPLHAEDPQALGLEAERAGKLQEAFEHYVEALQKTKEGSTENLVLREKIIGLSRKLDPPPEIPKRARSCLSQGFAQYDNTTFPEHLEVAMADFRQAVIAAPWSADAYFGLAMTLESTGKFSEAARDYKLSLMAGLSPEKAKVAEERLAKIPEEQLQYEKRKAEEESRKRRRIISSLSGDWKQFRGNVECFWRLKVTNNHELELVPVETFHTDNGSKSPLRKQDSGYFLGETDGNQITGYACSGKLGKDHSRAEAVTLTGEIQEDGAVIVLRYTFFFDPVRGSLLSNPSQTEARFVRVF